MSKNNTPLFQLWHFLPKHRKKQYVYLLLLVVISSIAEMVSIGSVLPFLGVITNPSVMYQSEYLSFFISFFNITKPDDMVIPFTLLFVIIVLISSFIRLTVLYVTTKLSYSTGADLSSEIYRRTLYQEYIVHSKRNSSEIINGVINKTGMVINEVIMPTLLFISSAFFTLSVISILLFINYVVAISAFVLFSAVYLLIIRFTKNTLSSNGELIAKESSNIIKLLQEGIGGIRDILIDNNQKFYCNNFRIKDTNLKQLQAQNIFFTGAPRYVVEAIGISLIAILALMLTQSSDDIGLIIPVLGVMAMGAQRLLPTVQKMYESYGYFRGAKQTLIDVNSLLSQPMPLYSLDTDSHKFMDFNKSIIFKNIIFKYNKSTTVLNDINLTIKKNSCVGFIGETGCGKTTLLDLLMGLYTPTEGSILIDENITLNRLNIVSWQQNIAHVPQAVFLNDSTFLENIAFGIPREKIDISLVEDVASKVCLMDLVKSWPDKFETVVGERGAKLSGGQRQRIGIARALYKQPNILVLDEATSALDINTEKNIMDIIHSLKNLTVLIIAHRLTTLEKCDEIVRLSKGRIAAKGDYCMIIDK